MKVSELKDGMRRVTVEGVVSEVSESRTVNLRTGGQAKVMDAVIKDESGSIKLSLWDDDIDKVQVGSKVRIENGYTNSFRGEIRVNVGRYGALQIIE